MAMLRADVGAFAAMRAQRCREGRKPPTDGGRFSPCGCSMAAALPTHDCIERPGTRALKTHLLVEGGYIRRRSFYAPEPSLLISARARYQGFSQLAVRECA